MNADEVHVWHMRRDCSDNAVPPALDLLDVDERARALRYRFPTHRNRFLAARIFLREALAQYLGIEARDVRLLYSNTGKPQMDKPRGIRFNLSHSGDSVAVAVTLDREVGIDVEEICRPVDAMGLAGRFFSSAEAAWVQSQPAALRQQAFFTCWTAKEAYLKARGEGLGFPLDAFEVLPASGSAELRLLVYGDPRETVRWSMQKLDLGAELCAAIAVERSEASICCSGPKIRKHSER